MNECVAQASPCLAGEICVNTEGSFACRRNTVTCGRGYHLSQDATQCEGTVSGETLPSFFFFLESCGFSRPPADVDECQTGNVCGGHGCVNLVGTYRCECRKGFFFNDRTRLCEGA